MWPVDLMGLSSVRSRSWPCLEGRAVCQVLGQSLACSAQRMVSMQTKDEAASACLCLSAADSSTAAAAAAAAHTCACDAGAIDEAIRKQLLEHCRHPPNLQPHWQEVQSLGCISGAQLLPTGGCIRRSTLRACSAQALCAMSTEAAPCIVGPPLLCHSSPRCARERAALSLLVLLIWWHELLSIRPSLSSSTCSVPPCAGPPSHICRWASGRPAEAPDR